MASGVKYVFTISMDVEPEREALFNEVYDNEHVPLLSRVPGIVSVTRLVTQPLSIIMGGERRTYALEGEPRYTAVYELERPDVLVSDAWAEAVDQGRWPTEVRPYTGNRRVLLGKVLTSTR